MPTKQSYRGRCVWQHSFQNVMWQHSFQGGFHVRTPAIGRTSMFDNSQLTIAAMHDDGLCRLALSWSYPGMGAKTTSRSWTQLSIAGSALQVCYYI